MSVRQLPPYPQGDLGAWARQLVEYLQNRDQSRAETLPSSPLMEHQTAGETPRASTDGITMFDPTHGNLVVAVSGVWGQVYSSGSIIGIGMHWDGIWSGGAYDRGSVVRDGDWTMIANKETTDRPAPQKAGAEEYLYTGTAPTVQTTAKTLVFGTEFTNPDSPYFFTGYRIYTVTGNRYRVYYDVEGQVTELFVFTADTIGWKEFEWQDVLVPSGTTFTLFAEVQEPDPTPTTFDLSLNYTNPQNPTPPIDGQITHSRNQPGVMAVDKDAGGQLAMLTPGDIIEGAGTRWSIQSVTDRGTYIDFGVAPATLGAPIGVQTFTFETVTPTPITVMADPDWWLSNPNVRSFYSIDGGAGVITDDAYGVDVQYVGAVISPDWDVLAVSGGGSGGEGSTDAFVLKIGDVMTGDLQINTTDEPVLKDARLYLKSDSQANLYLSSNEDGQSPASRSHLWFQNGGVNRGLLYTDSNDYMSLRHYNGATVGGQLRVRPDGIEISKMATNLDMNYKNLWRCNYVGFGVDATGDYIRWLTVKGMVGYENGTDTFRLYNGNETTRLPSVGSVTTSSNANVYTSSSGYLYRSTSSGKYKTNYRPLSGVSKQTVGNVIDALNPLIYTGQVPDEGPSVRSLPPDDNPDLIEKDQVGFIAEEVIAAIPEAALGTGDNFEINAVVAYLAAEVQALRQRVAALETPTSLGDA